MIKSVEKLYISKSTPLMGDDKYVENKCSSPIPQRVLKIDSENYLFNGTNTRQRSFSFTNGSSAPASNPYHNVRNSAGSLETDGTGARTPLMNMSFSPNVVRPPSPVHSVTSPPPSLSCARTLSYHSLFCFCHISCCCCCDSLCPPDCDDCIRAICVKFTGSSLTHPQTDILPPSTLRDKVSELF